MQPVPNLPSHVVIADQQAVYRAGLVGTLKEAPDFHVVGEAATLDELLSCVGMGTAFVVVDGAMADTDGFTRLAELCLAYGARVLFIAPAWSPSFVAVLRSGVVRDCVWRGVDGATLLGALRQMRVDGDPVAVLVHAGRTGQSSLGADELSVLALVAEGLSNAAIARQLDVPLPTVNLRVRRVLAKLGARGRAHAVSIGIRSGLLYIG